MVKLCYAIFYILKKLGMIVHTYGFRYLVG